MCPAARYACFPAGHAGPALQDSSAAALTGRRPLRTFTDGVPGLTRQGGNASRPGGEIFHPADGRPTTAYSVYVEEAKTLRAALDRAAEAALCIVDEGADRAMNKFN